MSQPILGTISRKLQESTATKPRTGQGETLHQTQPPADLIQELQKAVKALQTSVDILSARAPEGNTLLPESNKHSPQETILADAVDTTQEEHGPNAANNAIIIETMGEWPSPETIMHYKERFAKHRRECEKLQVELGCFIYYLDIVDGDKETNEHAELVRKQLLDSVKYLEQALNAKGEDKRDSMRSLKDTISKLYDSVYDIYGGISEYYDGEFWEWFVRIESGRDQISGLVNKGAFVECLDYIHNVFFSDLETGMGSLIKALASFEEKSANEWLEINKIEGFEKIYKEHTRRVFRSTESFVLTGDFLKADKTVALVQRNNKHIKVLNRMQRELDHLIAHYEIVGGFKESVDALKLMRDQLLVPVRSLEYTSFTEKADAQEALCNMVFYLNELHSSVERFRTSLYRQKHAFYFRKVKQWTDCLSNGLKRITALLLYDKPVECLDYIYYELFPELESTMIGESIELRKSVAIEEQFAEIDAGNVVEEMRTFGKESLPKFLVDEMERDTTRYLNLTTIATFFSSVTATTLQFTYAETDSVPSNSLRGVVNLFWFLSLVFSVSSGVSSLLGLTWRKSSVYDARVPPRLVRMWFDKAPMLFLVVAAVSFVIGLNMFAYLSLQPRYVSLSTTVLTGLHGVCLLTATAWFIYQLKHESIWAGWVRTIMKPITIVGDWIIMSVIKLIKISMEWVWKTVKWPYEAFTQNTNLQRNIYWAFGIDNRVARLNDSMDWKRDWPEPYLLSTLVRHIAYPLKKSWLVITKALSDLGDYVRNHMYVPSHTGNAEGDAESGERSIRDTPEAIEETSSKSPAGEAKNEFRLSLQKVFSEANTVDRIMYIIEEWKDEIDPSAKQMFRTMLWGYLDLYKILYNEVRSALAEEREKRRESEKEEQQVTTVEHLNTVPAVMEENKNVATPVQFSPPVPFDDGSRPLAMTETDVQPDSRTQPIDHRPTSGDRLSITVTEALEATSAYLIPLPEIGEAPTSHNEIEEVLSTSMNNNEGSRLAQSKVEPGE